MNLFNNTYKTHDSILQEEKVVIVRLYNKIMNMFMISGVNAD